MKKQLKLCITLFTLIFSSLTIICRTLPAAKATYVEGPITQDTDWTLVDSPFILSNNVTVNPSVTLAIEPGVQVKFGGDFSLIVYGKLVADGTGDKKISFTSNKLEPDKGDWGTIILDGPQHSSFTHCTVEYGKTGITLQQGSVNIQNSIIRLNSQNGTTIGDGDVTIKHNEITNNTKSGIHIAGGTQITVENNIIDSNGNGIVLTGNSTGEKHIEQNTILLNQQSGITLAANTYENTFIARNNISTNLYGFHVLSNTSTYITHNHISNNTVGIYYETETKHEAHFNDLYENMLAIDASLNATVEASYNYWGNKSGPYHESLNPKGTGNPVGGDGVNIDFIFFLSAPFDYNDTPPTATLWSDKTLVAPNQNVTFIGTNSLDEGRVDQYFFDFGDGTNTGWITLSLFNHTYQSTGNYTASLKVIDDFNATSQNAAITTITVEDHIPLSVTLTLANNKINSNGTVSATVYVSNESGPAGNANVTMFAVRDGSFSPASGQTDSNGLFTSTFTAPNVLELTNIRIIANASMSGYADGSAYAYVEVGPLLNIQVSIDPTIIKSEGTATVKVLVTDMIDRPVADAHLSLLSDNGTLSAPTGTTDSNGTATFQFTAPLTLNQINITIAVTASKAPYVEAQSQTPITVEPKLLVLEAKPDPNVIFSESTSTIIVNVTYNSTPVQDATVTASSDIGGDFTSQTTDSAGTATISFNAPQTTAPEGVNATITITATKYAYVNGQTQTTILIMPRVLTVQITAQSNTTIFGSQLNITIHVMHESSPIEGANVTLVAQSGSLSATSELTDEYGNATFIFTAPQVNEETNIILTASATISEYVGNTSQLQITVSPKTFSIQILTPPVKPGDMTTVTVQVTCAEDSTPADRATVTILLENGNRMTNTTDSTGTCTFSFIAPQTAATGLNMTTTVTKDGYKRSQLNITVATAQPEGGWSLTTTLLVIIPIVVVVTTVVLVKLKVIVVSGEEESR